MEFLEFKRNCISGGFCPRGTLRSKLCFKDYKINDCFAKYIKKVEQKEEKVDKDVKWIETQRAVWNRDAGFCPEEKRVKYWKRYCRLWKVLTTEEKEFFEKNNKEEMWLNQWLDVAHIKPRSTHPELKYDPSNCLLMGRFFHTRLEGGFSPLTGKKDGVDKWYLRAKTNSHDFGEVVLKEALHKVENMTVEEYEELYNEANKLKGDI